MVNRKELKLEEKENQLKYIDKVIDDGEAQLRDIKKSQMEMSNQFLNLAQRYNMMESNEFRKGYNEAMELFDDQNYELKRALKYVYEKEDDIKKDINKEKD